MVRDKFCLARPIYCYIYSNNFILTMVAGHCLVWLFAINRTTIPRIYNCSELVCAIVDLGIVGLSVMCAHYGHNLFISLCKN